jgi:probable F420-dependent oxidoreductase
MPGTKPRPFSFSVMGKTGGTRQELKEAVCRYEDLGYRAFLFNDHYIGPGPALSAANHPVQDTAAIPTVTLAAEYSRSLRVGFRVLCIDYHNPVVLAKELATLDLFSDGRLDIGLGAGWIATEYEAMGVPFDPPSTRIARLGDVVDILRACFGQGEVNVAGKHGVRAAGFEGVPKPVQRPGPPLAIGGGGRKVLELAARKADIVGFNLDNRSGAIGPDGARRSNAAAVKEKVGWVRDAAGDRFDDLELEIGAYLSMITDDPKAGAEMLGARFELPPEEVLEHPHALVGSVETVCEALIERRELYGFSSVLVLENVADMFGPVVARLSGT